MTHTNFSRTVGILAASGLVAVAIAAPGAALAAQPVGHTVTICHATNSDTNPYLQVTVDVASAGHLQGGHDTQHTGPIWDATLKAQHVAWGDIIPAYSFDGFSYAGMNLDGGLAIWLDDCVLPSSGSTGPATDETASGTPSTETPSTETPSGSAEADVLPTDALPTDSLEPVAVIQADPTPSDVATSPDPTATVEPTEGAIEIDGPFVTSTPSGKVEGATGYPDVTPPSTDTLGTHATSTPGAGLQLLLLAVTGLSILVLVAGRMPATRRR